jgi:hypothetical protein
MIKATSTYLEELPTELQKKFLPERSLPGGVDEEGAHHNDEQSTSTLRDPPFGSPAHRNLLK